MEFNKKTRSVRSYTVGLIIKLVLAIIVILGLVFVLNKLDLPVPIKEIEKIIPNENFKIVK